MSARGLVGVLAVLVAGPALAQTVVATGQVSKVSMGYEWVGWTGSPDSNGQWNTWAGVVPTLDVGLADGATLAACHGLPAEVSQCVGYSPVKAAAQCQMVEYTNISANGGTNLVGNGTYNSVLGASHHGDQVTRKLKPLLAMLSMRPSRGCRCS